MHVFYCTECISQNQYLRNSAPVSACIQYYTSYRTGVTASKGLLTYMENKHGYTYGKDRRVAISSGRERGRETADRLKEQCQ